MFICQKLAIYKSKLDQKSKIWSKIHFFVLKNKIFSNFHKIFTIVCEQIFWIF